MSSPAFVLKCQFCSAPMRSIDERRAACDHCGTEIVLPASFSIDGARLHADVSRGADASERAAAELERRRLLEEREALRLRIEQREAIARQAVSGLHRLLGSAVAIGLVGAMFGVLAGRVLSFGTLVLVASAFAAWGFAALAKRKRLAAAADLAPARSRLKEVEAGLARGRAILGLPSDLDE